MELNQDTISELEINQRILYELFRDVYGYPPRNIYSDVQWSDPIFVENEVERLTRIHESW